MPALCHSRKPVTASGLPRSVRGSLLSALCTAPLPLLHPVQTGSIVRPYRLRPPIRNASAAVLLRTALPPLSGILPLRWQPASHRPPRSGHPCPFFPSTSRYTLLPDSGKVCIPYFPEASPRPSGRTAASCPQILRQMPCTPWKPVPGRHRQPPWEQGSLASGIPVPYHPGA